MKKVVFFLLTLTFFFNITHGQVSSNENLNQIVMHHVEQNGFSGTILVAKEGKPLFQKSYGLAYLPSLDTIQNHYHFHIASISKLFTAIRIFQLIEEKSLDLHAPIQNYIKKSNVNIPNGISAHHLLLHISGLPDAKNKFFEQYYKKSDLVEAVFKKGKFKPTGNFYYNDMDYILLGLVIEEITGNDFQKEIHNHILDPLGMASTGFLAYGDYPKNFAYAYSEQKNGKLKQDPFYYIENDDAGAGMYSTATDLLKLDQALYGEDLLELKSLKTLSMSYPEYGYVGYSVWNYNYPFLENAPLIMERRGGILGANSVLVRMVEDNYTIIILSNNDRFNPDSFGDENNLREALIRAMYNK